MLPHAAAVVAGGGASDSGGDGGGFSISSRSTFGCPQATRKSYCFKVLTATLQRSI